MTYMNQIKISYTTFTVISLPSDPVNASIYTPDMLAFTCGDYTGEYGTYGTIKHTLLV